MDDRIYSLIEDFYAVASRTNQLKSKAVTFDGRVSVNTASLHLIETVGNHPGANTTELAELLGITKGAVSQMAAKLSGKGLLEKRKMPGNAKEVSLALTPEGKKLCREHDKLHRELYKDLSALMNDFSPADIEKVHLFLRNIEIYMDQYAKRLSL
jgi:Transcriptional regulators